MLFLKRYIGDFYLLRQIIYLIFILVLMTIAYSFFNNVNIPKSYADITIKAFCLLLLAFFVIKRPRGPQYHFSKFVLLFSFLPFLSIINSLSLFNQGIRDGFIATLPSCIWLLYYVLHYFNVKEGTLLRGFLLCGLFIVGVQIVQQNTYPDAVFGVFTEEISMEKNLDGEIARQRNGLWRFNMNNNMYYTAPFLFAAWIWLKKKFDIRLLIIIALFLVSTYLTLTRQVMVAMVLTLVFSAMFGTKRKKWKTILFVLVLLWGGYEYYDVLFESLEVQTEEDSLGARLFAFEYFWKDSLRNISTFLFGYGDPSGSSSFSEYVQHLAKDLKCFASDVGFVGVNWKYGVLYVISSFYLLYFLFYKMRKVVPGYIRLFVLYVTIMSIMIFPMGVGSARNIMWPLLLYIIDLHLNQSPLSLPTTDSSQL